MSCRFLLIVSVVLVSVAIGPAQNPGKPRPNDVEVRFADSSAVRMTLLEDRVEVVTKYGPLTVPTGEIRRIDFGIHLTDEASEKIRGSIMKLGSDVHREREAATSDLAALGYQAYPALHAAAKSGEAEVARRAEEAIKQIRAKVPANLLRLRVADRIETAEFPIVGRITSPSLKVRSAYFGERPIKIADLVTIRSLASGGSFECTVDAAKHGSAPGQWMDTGLQVQGESELVITASGNVDLWVDGTGQYVTGPNGYQDGGGGPRRGNGGHRSGALLGRIGDNGEVFVIGEHYKGKAGRDDGKLYLHIVPSSWGNPSVGSYKVKVTTGNEP
jgi:hypothetical protein